MNSSNFQKNIALISVFILLLLIIFLLTVKSKKKLPNKLFACYLFLLAVDTSGSIISSTIINVQPNLEIFRWTLTLLNIPIFYLYTLSICYDDFHLNRRHLLHFIPFVVLNLILIFRIYSIGNLEKINFFKHHYKTVEMIIFQYMIEIQYLFYIIILVIVLKKYRQIYLENYSYFSNIVYKWLSQMIVVFMVVHYFATFKNILRYTDYHQLLKFINSFLEIIALIAISWFVLKALKYSEFFKGINIELKLVKDFPVERGKETIKDGEKINENYVPKFQIETLTIYMTEMKPYLDPSLTVQHLASQMNISARELSILINSNMNMHFFDFVNQYRIENAMELLRNYSKRDFTTLEILYKVGFNSKSSFNSAFKKYTALTPTEYRNKFSKID
jgi:AraC-like DNA-binding protein